MKALIITTDFSESALNAAQYAAALATPLGAKHIVLYHSYDNAPAATDIPVAEADTTLAHEELFHRSVSKQLIRESDIPLLLLREKE